MSAHKIQKKERKPPFSAVENGMVEVKNLVKRYGQHYALNGVSFSIGDGEIVGLLGPNGAGKSTMMNILTGYLAATAGEVFVGGISITEDPTAVKRSVGYLPEQPPLYPDMTVEEYLRFVYELKGCTLPREPHLREICDAVKLSDVRHRLIRNLSKGYKQRVGIAEALVGNPPILIFDEPTVGLDPKQIIEIRNLLRMLARKHTVILSTHILPEVQAVCERIIVIDRGSLIADERTVDITRTIEGRSRYRIAIAANDRGAVLDALRHTAGVRQASTTESREGDAYLFTVEGDMGIDVRKPIFYLCAKNDWPILAFEKAELDLEEIFLRLVDNPSENKKKDRKRGR